MPLPAGRFRASASTGQPLPAAVQSRMQALFGADFSQVRIHVDNRAATLGAVAFAQGMNLHFAPGRYDPASPAGQRLLGHELAHVVQQRTGRAQNPFGGGLALVQDPGLEAEAERMGLRAVAALAAPIAAVTAVTRPIAPVRPVPPATPARRPAGIAQPYFKIVPENVHTRRDALRPGAPRALVSATPSFHGQEEGGEEFLAGGRARIVSADRVALRVSDDCQMAIEDSDLRNRQPKVFFATAAVFRQSRIDLERVASGFRLVQGSETLRLLTATGVEHTLRSIYPLPTGVRRSPELSRVTANQNCNDIASSVIGTRANAKAVLASPPTGVPATVRTVTNQVHNTVADLVARVLREADTGLVYNDRRVVTNAEWKEDSVAAARKMREAIIQVSRDYTDALRSGSADRLLAQLGINRHAAPEVGDAFVIHAVAAEDEDGEVTDWAARRSFRPRWSYHWGGVVAKSGTDVITLENYDRATGGNRDSDPRWYFQMYGRGRDQSFHEVWAASNDFANPITLAMRNPNRKPAPRPSAIPWKTFLFLVVVAVLIRVGLLVFG